MRLIKTAQEAPGRVPADSVDSAKPLDKFKRGMNELRETLTLDDLSKALANGVKISIDGFRARNKIGNNWFAKECNRDHLSSLKSEIDRIEREILGQAKLKIVRGELKRTSISPSRKSRKSSERIRLEKMKLLLEARDRDVEKLTKDLSLAYREIAELKARLNFTFNLHQ